MKVGAWNDVLVSSSLGITILVCVGGIGSWDVLEALASLAAINNAESVWALECAGHRWAWASINVAWDVVGESWAGSSTG